MARLIILPSSLPKCRNYRHVSSHPTQVHTCNGWAILHSVDLSHFLYCSISWNQSRVILSLGYSGEYCNKRGCGSLSSTLILFSLERSTYPIVELLGGVAVLFLVLESPSPNCFHNGCTKWSPVSSSSLHPHRSCYCFVLDGISWHHWLAVPHWLVALGIVFIWKMYSWLIFPNLNCEKSFQSFHWDMCNKLLD